MDETSLTPNRLPASILVLVISHFSRQYQTIKKKNSTVNYQGITSQDVCQKRTEFFTYITNISLGRLNGIPQEFNYTLNRHSHGREDQNQTWVSLRGGGRAG